MISSLIMFIATILRRLGSNAFSSSLPSEIGLLTALTLLYCCNLLLVLRWILGLFGYILGAFVISFVIRVVRIIRVIIVIKIISIIAGVLIIRGIRIVRIIFGCYGYFGYYG